MRTKQETILKFEWVARQAQLGLDTIALQSAELRSDRNNRPSIVTYSLNEAKKLPLLGGIQRVVQQMEKEGHVFCRSEDNLTRPYCLDIAAIRKIYEYLGVKSYADIYGREAIVCAHLNLKGGVGKTTSLANIATGLVHVKPLIQKRLKILVMDLDPQGAATFILGVNPNESRTAMRALLDNPSRTELLDRMYPTASDGLYVLPAATTDGFMAMSLPEVAQQRNIPLSAILEESVISKIRNDFDLILIDYGPHLEPSFLNILASVDGFVIPVATDRVDLDSTFKFMRGLSNLLLSAVHDFNVDFNKFKVLLTRYDEGNKDHERVWGLMCDLFASTMFASRMPMAKPFAASQARQGTVYDIPTKDYVGDGKSLNKARMNMDSVVLEFYGTYLGTRGQ